MDWCLRHLPWTARKWSTVGLSDESRFNVRFMVESLLSAFLERDILMPPSESMLVLVGGSVIVLAGITFNRRTQLYVNNGNLNSQRYINEIFRPIVMPF